VGATFVIAALKRYAFVPRRQAERTEYPFNSADVTGDNPGSSVMALTFFCRRQYREALLCRFVKNPKVDSPAPGEKTHPGRSCDETEGVGEGAVLKRTNEEAWREWSVTGGRAYHNG